MSLFDKFDLYNSSKFTYFKCKVQTTKLKTSTLLNSREFIAKTKVLNVIFRQKLKMFKIQGELLKIKMKLHLCIKSSLY